MIIIRKIGFCLLFLSALLLILNSVLPHHHHQENVCFVADHCENDESDHTNSNNEHNGLEHNHQESETDFCLINSLFFTQIDQSIFGKIKLHNSKKDISGQYNLMAVNFALIKGVVFNNKVLKEPYCSLNPKNLTRALRAPPIC